VIVGYLLFRSSKRIDIQRLFKVTSVLLVFVAAGVLSYGVAEWQEIGVLPGAERIVLDLSALLSDGSLAEILLGGVLNIHAHTSLLQVIGYMVFVGLVLPPVMRPTRVPSAVAASTPR
jgi:high-affinity iron transporter